MAIRIADGFRCRAILNRGSRWSSPSQRWSRGSRCSGPQGESTLIRPPAAYDVQRFDGAAWTTVHEVRANTEAANTLTFAQPALASRVRIINTVPVAGSVAQLAELQVFRRVLVSGTTFTNVAVPNGRHTYALAALNSCGVQGPAAGTQAAIGDVTPPPAPSALSASSAASTVSLSWTGVTAADLAGYIVYRRSDDGVWTQVTATPVAGTSFADQNVANGTYAYRVTARDTAGNESAPSNEASATLAVTPPSAPASLLITVPAVGEALDLSWTQVTGAFGYRVFRAPVTGGPLPGDRRGGGRYGDARFRSRQRHALLLHRSRGGRGRQCVGSKRRA